MERLTPLGCRPNIRRSVLLHHQLSQLWVFGCAGDSLLQDAVQMSLSVGLVRPNDHIVVVQMISESFVVKVGRPKTLPLMREAHQHSGSSSGALRSHKCSQSSERKDLGMCDCDVCMRRSCRWMRSARASRRSGPSRSWT